MNLQSLSNALRVFSVEMVTRANSGHPGMPLGASDIATVLFSKFLKFDFSFDLSILLLVDITIFWKGDFAKKTSPFFEFYIDELLPIINKKHTFLLDLNFNCHLFVMEALQLEIPFLKTLEYE